MTANEPSTTGLPRRTLLKGAAWSVPVIAVSVATPLASASQTPCVAQGTASWSSNYTRQDAGNGTGVAVTESGRTIPYTVTSTHGPNVEYNTGNLGVGPAGLAVGTLTTVPAPDLGINPDYRLTTTITFAEPVSNLRFSIGDIDGNGTSGQEWIGVQPSNVIATPGSALVSEGNWYRAPEGTPPQDSTNPAYAVQYTATGEISSVRIFLDRPTYTLGQGGVVISDLFFDVPC